MKTDLTFLDGSPCLSPWLGLPIQRLSPPFLLYPTEFPSVEARLQGTTYHLPHVPLCRQLIARRCTL